MSLCRVVGRALPHHRRGAVGERAVDDVGVPGDPADVSGAPVHVGLRPQVEHVAVGRRRHPSDSRRSCAGSPSAWPSSRRCRGCTGGARRRAARRAVRIGGSADLVVEDVAPLFHLAGECPELRTTTIFSSVCRSPITSSTRSLTGAVLPLRAAPSTVIEQLGLGELHPLAHGLGGEAAEDDVVRRADPRAREHRDDHLGDHRQVDADDVALLHALVLQRVGEALAPRRAARRR